MRLDLRLEARRLVLRIVQLGEAVGDLAAGDEQLEAVGDRRVGVAGARQRRDVGRVRDDEGRLHQLVLGRRLEQLQLQQPDAVGREHLDVERRQRHAQVLGLRELGQRVLRVVLVDRLGHRQPVERPAEVDGLALVGDRRGAEHALRDLAEQRLGEVHQVAVVPVRLVELEHRELGVVPRRDAFVAEVAVDLEHLLEAADDQPLEVQLRRDAQEELACRARCGA